MIVNQTALDLAFKGFKTKFNEGWESVEPSWDRIAMTIRSTSRDETYGWLGQFPELREWAGGERLVKDLQAHGFTIVNKKYESTVDVKRDDFEDDRLGTFAPIFQRMGETARRHPDTLVFPLLSAGFTTLCYDGQNFFDADHPYGATYDVAGAYTGALGSVSNVTDAGQGDPAWYLMQTRGALKPIIFQERVPYQFQAVNRPDDHEVFMTDEFKYGIRARSNVGFGLWQLAYAVKAPLTAATYKAARQAMMGFRGDNNQLLGIMPDLMVVPPALEEEARVLLTSDRINGGDSNPWRGTADLLVSQHIA
jgi:phage major head subunit gpT-like protein